MIKKPLSSRGFTIVELLIVIVVIGILAAITIVAYNGIQQRATIASLNSDLDNASKTIKLFQVDNSAFPTTINCAVPDSTTNKCVKSSNGTTYQYISTIAPQLFCLTATNSTYSYNIGQDGTPLAGPCPILRFDAGNSISYPGTGTTWTDVSGNGNNGNLVNGVGFSSANGGSLSFNGVNNNVDAGTNPIFDITGPMSLDAWVKTTQISFGGIVTKYSAPGLAYGYDLSVYNNKTAFNIRSGANGWNATAFSNTAINDNNWHYVVGVYNGSSVIAYDNAVAGPSSPWSFGSSPSSSSLQIGSRGGSGYFAGQISNVRIYNKALSQSDIDQNFNASRGRYGI